MHKFTKAQLTTLKNIHDRPVDHPTGLSYLQFRRTAFLAFSDCMMVPWCGMVLGIETDGYAHS